MGLLDWLFGKRSQQPASPPKPRVISGLVDGSPFVVLDTGNGMTTIIGPHGLRVHVRRCPEARPVSARARRDASPGGTRARVWAGGMMRDNPTTEELLTEEADPHAVEAFRRAFRISEAPTTFSHCMCLGQPTIELLDAAGKRVGTLGMQHHRTVRWDYWKHDAQLLDGQVVERPGLADHGVPTECMG